MPQKDENIFRRVIYHTDPGPVVKSRMILQKFTQSMDVIRLILFCIPVQRR